MYYTIKGIAIPHYPSWVDAVEAANDRRRIREDRKRKQANSARGGAHDSIPLKVLCVAITESRSSRFRRASHD